MVTNILMCRPEYFTIAYEINPWMHTTNQVDHKKALRQWQALHDWYFSRGVAVHLIDPVEGLADMTFVANGGLVCDNVFICSHHRFRQRQGEEKHVLAWFRQAGYETHTLSHTQSGQGDALFYRGTLYGGYGFRSDREAYSEVASFFNMPITTLHLVDPYFYDFDMAFCPVGNKAVLYCPEVFDRESQKTLSELDCGIAITRAQALSFACNSVLVGDTLAMCVDDADIRNKLSKIGIKVKVFDLGEFQKSGGAIKCLTLALGGKGSTS